MMVPQLGLGKGIKMGTSRLASEQVLRKSIRRGTETDKSKTPRLKEVKQKRVRMGKKRLQRILWPCRHRRETLSNKCEGPKARKQGKMKGMNPFFCTQYDPGQNSKQRVGGKKGPKH